MVINNYQQDCVKFDIRGIRVSAEEVIFYIGLILWYSQFYISRTIFMDLFGGRLITAVRYFCMLIFAVKIVLSEKTVHMRAAAVFITAAAVFVVVQLNINTGMPLIQILLLVYGAKNISFKRICTVSMFTCAILWLIPVMTDAIGVNEIEESIINGRVRGYLNFVFVAYGSIYYLNIVFCTFYFFTKPDRLGKDGRVSRRVTTPWPVIILMSAVGLWLYKATDTALPFAICVLFIALYVIVVKLRVPVIQNNFLCRFLAVIFFPLTAFVTYIAAENYNSKVAWMSKLNTFTHKRLAYSNQGLKKYGVHLLGTQIVENTDSTRGTYFYLDSAYMKDMIYYGLIVFIMILLFYSVMLYASVLENDKTLAIWLICIALYSMFNNLLTSPAENAAMFGIWYAIDLLKWHRKKGRAKSLYYKRKRIEYKHTA